MAKRDDYVTVDVFTDHAFAGDPLAVVTDATGLSPEHTGCTVTRVPFGGRYALVMEGTLAV
jgi:hypothetical protein